MTKGIAVIALLAVAGLAIWKHGIGLKVQGSVSTGGTAEAQGYPSGVSQYTPQVAPQSAQQVLASQLTHPMQVTPVGFAPAFGEDENQPGAGESLI